MNADTPRTSAVTDYEYQMAIAAWATAQKECKRIAAELAEAEEAEMLMYKHLKQIRATIAAETLEVINGR